MLDYSDYEIYQFIKILRESRPVFYLQALCNGKDMPNFFPGRGQSALIQRAIDVCNYCPVKYECHTYAIEQKIEHGVWGGSTPIQRIRWIQSETTPEEAWQNLNLE